MHGNSILGQSTPVLLPVTVLTLLFVSMFTHVLIQYNICMSAPSFIMHCQHNNLCHLASGTHGSDTTFTFFIQEIKRLKRVNITIYGCTDLFISVVKSVCFVFQVKAEQEKLKLVNTSCSTLQPSPTQASGRRLRGEWCFSHDSGKLKCSSRWV